MNEEYRVGISTTVDYTIPIEYQFELFSQIGFDFVSLGADLVHSQYLNPPIFKSLMAKFPNLPIESVHIPFGKKYDPAISDSSNREKVVNRIVRFLEITSRYNIGLAIFHPHYYLTTSKEKTLEYALKGMESLLKRIPSDILLVVENLPTGDGSWLCDQILEYFNENRIGFCYDSSHENMSGEPFHLLDKYYNRLTTSHLSDNHGQSDEHLIPEDGHIDWKRLKSYFDRSPLDHVLMEVGTGEKLNVPVDKFIRETYNRVQRIFNSRDMQ